MKEFIKTCIRKRYENEQECAKQLFEILFQLISEFDDGMHRDERNGMMAHLTYLFSALDHDLLPLHSYVLTFNQKKQPVFDALFQVMERLTNFYVQMPDAQSDLLNHIDFETLQRFLQAKLSGGQFVVQRFLDFERLPNRVRENRIDPNLLMNILMDTSAIFAPQDLAIIMKKCDWQLWQDLMTALVTHPNINDDDVFLYRLQFLQNPFLLQPKSNAKVTLYANWLRNSAVLNDRMNQTNHLKQSTTVTLFRQGKPEQVQLFLNSFESILLNTLNPATKIEQTLLTHNQYKKTALCELEVASCGAMMIAALSQWQAKKYMNHFVMRKLLQYSVFVSRVIADENVDEKIVLQLLDFIQHAVISKEIDAEMLVTFLSKPLEIAMGTQNYAMPKEYHPLLTSLSLNPNRRHAFEKLLVLLNEWKLPLYPILASQSLVVDAEEDYSFNRMNILHIQLYVGSANFRQLLNWIKTLVQQKKISIDQLRDLMSPSNAPNQLFDRMYSCYSVMNSAQHLKNLECLWQTLFFWYEEKILSAIDLVRIFSRNVDSINMVTIFFDHPALNKTPLKTWLTKQLFLLFHTPYKADDAHIAKMWTFLRSRIISATAVPTEQLDSMLMTTLQIALIGHEDKSVTRDQVFALIQSLTEEDRALKHLLLKQANQPETMLGRFFNTTNWFPRLQFWSGANWEKLIQTELDKMGEVVTPKEEPEVAPVVATSSTSSSIVIAMPDVPTDDPEFEDAESDDEEKKKELALAV